MISKEEARQLWQVGYVERLKREEKQEAERLNMLLGWAEQKIKESAISGHNTVYLGITDLAHAVGDPELNKLRGALISQLKLLGYKVNLVNPISIADEDLIVSF